MHQVAYAPQAAPEGREIVVRPDCAGRARELLPIALSNALLTIVTLGIYRFWAKTRVRRYLWSRTSLLGDPFEYTGTGGELFRGFVVVTFVVLLPLFAYSMAVELLLDPESPLTALALVPLYAFVIFLVGVAIHRARRYRFSRTTWRGVRGAQTGSAARYGLGYLGFFLLDALSLGWTYPWTKLRLTGALTDDTWFGDGRFAFAGSSKPLYRRFAAAWALAALAVAAVAGCWFIVANDMPEDATSGDMEAAAIAAPLAALLVLALLIPLLTAWYRARELAWFAACTRYEGLQARYDVTAGALIRLSVGNALLLLATLGLGGPFVELRNLRFACERLSFAGAIDVSAIGQSPAPRPAQGEGLADAFDVGAV